MRHVRSRVVASGSPCSLPTPTEKGRELMSLEKGSSSNSSDKASESMNNSKNDKKPHIKKPLNAFMLYMKEMRAKVVAECTFTESSAINQTLGRRWKALSPEEQAKYNELARLEQQLHKQLYPDWTCRKVKKKKRKKETANRENHLKKCRARYGLDQKNQWCKPCRRKKKCVRYMEALAAASGTVPLPMATPQSPCSDDDVKLEVMSDASSDGDADTPLNSASSPGGLSALSSLASPASDPPPALPRKPVRKKPLSVRQLMNLTWPRAFLFRSGNDCR